MTGWGGVRVSLVGYARAVTDREALEGLTAQELHDRATRLAWRRLDVGFLWHLLSTIPEARAAVGDEDRSEIDILRPLALLNDLVDADRGELAEGLRPLYLDYLVEHEKAEDLEASDDPDLGARGRSEEDPDD
jgi:hypothetical protein